MYYKLYVREQFRIELFFFLDTYIPAFDTESSKLNKNMEVVLYVFSVSVLFTFLCTIALLIYDPTSVIFFGALIPPKYYAYFPVGILAILYHTFYLFVLCFNLIYTMTIILVFLLYVTILLTKEMSLSRNKYKTLDILRQPENLRVAYRAFQVLFANFVCFIGPFVSLAHAFSVCLPIFCNFFLIRYWGNLNLISKLFAIMIALILFSVWTFVLQLGKYLFVRGNKIVGSWKRQRWENKIEEKVMERFQKSYRLVLIRCGNQLVLGRITQFNFVKSIMRGTFRSLLTSK